MIIFFITYSILITLLAFYNALIADNLESELKQEQESRKFWLGRARQESDRVDELELENGDLIEDVEYYHQLLKDFGYELDDNWNWVKSKKSKK